MKKDREIQNLIDAIPSIERVLGYSFTMKEHLLHAFIHRSYLNECALSPLDREEIQHNERLEFLGDSVVNLYVTEELFRRFPEMTEGMLSQHKALLVSEKTFSKLIGTFGIAHHLVMGRGERIQRSYRKASIAADLFEAIIGATYLDGGFQSVKKVLDRLLGDSFFTFDAAPSQENPKAVLQELFARNGMALPKYVLVDEKGPQHEKKFCYSVVMDGSEIGRGSGKTKKEAQKNAARSALEYIQEKGLSSLVAHTEDSPSTKKSRDEAKERTWQS